MSRKKKKGSVCSKIAGLAVTAGLFGLVSMAVSADDWSTETSSDVPVEKRTSESLNFAQGARANRRDPLKGSLSLDQYAPLVTGARRSASPSKPAAGKQSTGTAESSTHEFWIFTADVVLFNDYDADGYYYGIDLLFDADTVYSSAQVYAAVYLSYEGGPWNEYAVTEDFTIFGASGSDEYVLATELMSGYVTGNYDLLIELFDAVDGSFVTSFGPDETSELSILPLEDFGRDAPATETRIAVSQGGGGGAVGVWMLLAMLAGKGLVRRRYPARN